MKKEFLSGGKRCVCFGSDEPSCVLIQPEESDRLDGLEAEYRFIGKMVDKPFLLAGLSVEDWNSELSPWKAPAVFGSEGFGDGAAATLEFIERKLLPSLCERFDSLPVVLGGYSLAGLFSLWASFNSSSFQAVSAASASVWFPGWLDYASERECRASHVYLSLGDKEEKTRNPVMATVGSCMRSMDEVLSRKGTDHILEWNEGNHFKDADLRCAKGFAWALKQI